MVNFRGLIPLSAAVAIAILGAGAPAVASNENDGGNETGGYVVPGSLDGVNPVYHPGIFRNSEALKAYGFAPPPRRPHRQPQHGG